MNSSSRWINLEGAVNVRDLGGYDIETGSTRWNNLLRADNLHRLTEDDQRKLLEVGVRTIIDLRHKPEVDSAPNVLADHAEVRYLNIPIFRQMPDSVTPANVPDLASVFRYMVDSCQPGFGEALTAIAEAGEGAVLYHCTAGKDRTGIMSALLLGLAGVAPEDIVEDFTLTTEAMKRLRPIILEQVKQSGGDPEQVNRLLTSDAADMTSLLDYIGEKYGDIPSYVKQLGLSEEQINRLRARLVEGEALRYM